MNKNNKIIAEFLGWESVGYPSHMKSPFHGRDIWWSPASSDGKTRSFCCEVGKEHFHDSWEWLLPVILKITEFKHWSINATLEWLSESQEKDGLYTIKDIYSAVIEYITFINKKEDELECI